MGKNIGNQWDIQIFPVQYPAKSLGSFSLAALPLSFCGGFKKATPSIRSKSNSTSTKSSRPLRKKIETRRIQFRRHTMDKIIQTGSHIEKGSYQNLIASFQFFVKVWITIVVLVLIDSLPPEQTVPSRRKPPCHSQPGLGWSSHHKRQSA